MSFKSIASIGGSAIGGLVTGLFGESQTEKQIAAQRGLEGLRLSAQKEIADKQLAQALSELRGRQVGQEEALGRATGIRQAGESEFEQATTGTPPAIEQLKTLIRERALPEQQQALAQTKLGLSQAGVRGPEAGLIAQQQASKMGLDLSRAVEEIALKQALADREKRATMAGTKALAGLTQELTPIQKVAGKSNLEIEQEKKLKAQEAELKKVQEERARLAAQAANRRRNPYSVFN
jgi:hypothetical protein